MNHKQNLERELRLAGAKPRETKELIALAGRLRELKVSTAKPEPRAKPWWRRWHAVPLGSAAAGLLLGGVLVAYAQTSLPGSWPYPAKRASEKVAVTFDSNYRATLMMRRAQEVRQLVSQRAKSSTILATLADYQAIAAAYKSSNYAAFEYCKTNLEQAAAVATSTERAAIDNTLSLLQT